MTYSLCIFINHKIGSSYEFYNNLGGYDIQIKGTLYGGYGYSGPHYPGWEVVDGRKSRSQKIKIIRIRRKKTNLNSRIIRCGEAGVKKTIRKIRFFPRGIKGCYKA